MAENTILEVRNLTKIYRLGNVTLKALDDVSFEVTEGQVVCITGKSGAGKSTLLHQLGLLDRPTDGQVFFKGQEVTGLSDAARSRLRLKQLGYVFQEFALLQELTAIENVYLPGMMTGITGLDYRRRAGELLDLVDLGGRWRHRPKELSGGEQQRVAIARALINGPQLLFADEPCANLDTASSKMIMKTLVRLNAEIGLSIVFVSHDPDDKRYSSMCLMLGDGRLLGNTQPSGVPG